MDTSPPAQTPVLCGTFSLLGSRRKFDVELTNSLIRYRPTGSHKEWTNLSLNDVIGAQCMKGKTDSDQNAYLSLFAYPRGKSLTGGSTPLRKRHVQAFGIGDSIVFTENLQVAERWKSAVIQLCRPRVNGEFRNPYSATWLIVINPGGGQGKAERMFKERVVPILAEADIVFEVLISERAGHVTECARNLDLRKYSAMVAVSGDGLIHEAINGLMFRKDWWDAIQLPLGFIPGGSGNALAASIHEACGEPFHKDFVKHAALLLTKSIPTAMDLLFIEWLTEKRYAFLSVGWGLLADIDIESEKFRVLGENRFTVGAIQRLVDLRTYCGTISYLPADAACDIRSRADYREDSTHDTPRTDLLVPLTDPVPSNWTKIEGEFVSVYLVSISRLGISSVGVPWAKLDDGLAYLYWIRAGASKASIMNFLLNMAGGEHLKSSCVEMAAVRAFRFEPNEKEGIMTIDGELVPYGPIQGQMLPSLATVLTRSNQTD